jgi:hypothetical protein
MKKVFILALVATACLTASLSATTVAYVPLGRSIQMSDLVLVGHVMGLEAGYNRNGEIVTRVHLLVEESFKGGVRPGEIFIYDAWGGSLDGVNMITVGEAHYQLGDKVFVQLESIDGEYHTLGLSFGKWNVLRAKNGSQVLSRSLDDLNMVGVTETPVETIPLRQMRQLARAPF